MGHPGRSLAAITLLALVLRLWSLGARTIHWDEARVAYWTVRYLDSGVFFYRPIVHGPFLQIVNRHVFALLGPTDAKTRLVVALLGGVLPASVWLLRAHLDDAELLAVATVLAVDPLLLYFSRFSRADVPLAVFAFVAFAFAVRAYDTGRVRYLLAAGLAAGLATTTKENVLVYLACGLGACVLAVGTRVLSRHTADGTALGTALGETTETISGRLRPLLPGVGPALLLALVPILVFYTPRGVGEPAFGALLGEPTLLPAAVGQATLGTWETFVGGIWADSATRDHPYLPYLLHFVGILAVGSAVSYTLAVGGTVRELWRGVRHRSSSAVSASPAPRGLVVGTAGWGFVSVLGYPLGTDVMAPWLGVHVIVPLAVPAGVGLVALLRWGSERLRQGDRATAGAVLLVCLLLGSQVAFVAYTTSYTTPTPRVNAMAQGAQPGDDLDPLVADIEATAGYDPGVLYYGERFFLPNESVADRPPRPDADAPWLGFWLRRLPMAWYAERAGVETDYVWKAPEFRDRESYPPVVIAPAEEADVVRRTLPDYRSATYDTALYGNRVVVFTDEPRLNTTVN
nr:flippase activity-associated protein Agl23 [Salinirubrum litoreum]